MICDAALFFIFFFSYSFSYAPANSLFLNIYQISDSTAGEGGAWGIALLASYLVNKEEGETLESFLDNKVFADQESSTLDPKPEGVAGFNAFMDSYMKGLSIERAAVESEIW